MTLFDLMVQEAGTNSAVAEGSSAATTSSSTRPLRGDAIGAEEPVVVLQTWKKPESKR